MVRGLLRGLFSRILPDYVTYPRVTPCEACQAYREYIDHLREENRELRNSLFRVVHIPVSDNVTTPVREHLEPVQTRPTKTWPQIKRELENKHKKKPEDQVADYWANKANTLEQEVGLVGGNDAG